MSACFKRRANFDNFFLSIWRSAMRKCSRWRRERRKARNLCWKPKLFKTKTSSPLSKPGVPCLTWEVGLEASRGQVNVWTPLDQDLQIRLVLRHYTLMTSLSSNPGVSSPRVPRGTTSRPLRLLKNFSRSVKQRREPWDLEKQPKSRSVLKPWLISQNSFG